MARERTGEGQYVDISMLDGVISLMHMVAMQYFSSGRIPERGKDMLTGGVPNYNTYQTKDDKYISLGSLEPWFFQNLCKALGREDLIPYEWDEGKRGEISSYFRDVFRTKTRDEWFKLLRQSDICVAPVYTIDEVFTDPHVIHRRMVEEVDHPRFRKVKHVGISVKLSKTPGAIRSPAPSPGQHTDEILTELGYAKEVIEGLKREGAIG